MGIERITFGWERTVNVARSCQALHELELGNEPLLVGRDERVLAFRS